MKFVMANEPSEVLETDVVDVTALIAESSVVFQGKDFHIALTNVELMAGYIHYCKAWVARSLAEVGVTEVPLIAGFLDYLDDNIEMLLHVGTLMEPRSTVYNWFIAWKTRTMGIN